jgi:cellulose synthase/poly-beta-1,6-N-acetylglucosamine synthase-like glycosyltransferase
MLSIFVFLAAVAFGLYVVIGYPLLLGILARISSKPIRKDRQQKSVSILVAVHNGELFIADKLASILSLDYPRELVEIVIVSDGSSDRTDSIVKPFVSDKLRLIEIPRAGKCAALNEAISRANNEILLLTDVRQTVAPDSLQLLVDCFADPSVGVVSGELKIREGRNSSEASTGLYWRYESWIRGLLSSVDSMFGATGPFYAMRRELAVPLPADILLDDMYLPLAAFFKGYRLIQEPRARALDYPTSRQVEFRRKVRTLAGNYQILRAYPALLGAKNRIWFHFVSYKLGRLILPWSFIVAFLSSCFLPVPWKWCAICGQAFFYLLAAVDPWIPDGLAVKRLTSMVRTIVAMLLATLCGLSILFVPPKSLWKETKIDSVVPSELRLYK